MFSLDGVSRVWGATVAMILKNSVIIISLYFSCSAWLRFTYAVRRVNTEVWLGGSWERTRPNLQFLCCWGSWCIVRTHRVSPPQRWHFAPKRYAETITLCSSLQPTQSLSDDHCTLLWLGLRCLWNPESQASSTCNSKAVTSAFPVDCLTLGT